jgi:Na+-transporting methylmalonyl-CoA/oxaloacetate decarboxylase gamma subunit
MLLGRFYLVFLGMRYIFLFPLLFVLLSAVSAQQIRDFVYATPVSEIQEYRSGDL